MKIRALSISLLLINGTLIASKTTFIPRLMSTDQTFELALTNYNFRSDWQAQPSLCAIKPFYQISTGNIGSFMLINNQKQICINEQGCTNVNSLWLNLIAADGLFYQSTFAVRPKRKTCGLIYTFDTYLPHISKKLWISLNTALVYARHTLHMCELSVYPGTLPDFSNACQALNNPAWCAGKFYNHSLNKVGLDDIQGKIGWDMQHNATSWLAIYSIFTIPTTKKFKPTYVFAPLVGSNHASIGAGFDAAYTAWQHNNHIVSLLADVNYRYVFTAHERRTFDLCNGDWSRYLQVVTQSEPYFSIPGINYFTRKALVTPANTLQLWTAIHHQQCNYHTEIGYNLWVRGTEKVRIACECSTFNVGIFDISGVCNPPATTASTAGICQGISGNNMVTKDATFTPVTLNNFNIASAANSITVTNKVYASTGYKYDIQTNKSIFLAVSSSYEYCAHNNALNQFAIWFNVEFIF